MSKMLDPLDPLTLLARPSAPEPPESELAAIRRKLQYIELRQDLMIDALRRNPLPTDLAARLDAMRTGGDG